MNKVLIIDDNDINIDVCIQNLIPPLGCYEVLTAENGLEGYNQAVLHTPDLIILDIMMPVMNGYETIKKLKLNEHTKDIPILMLTAKSTSEDVALALELGANDYIKKPFSVIEFAARVNGLVTLRNSQLKTKQYIKLLESKADMLHALAEGAHDLNGMLSSMGIIELLRDEINSIKSVLPESVMNNFQKNFDFINRIADNTQNIIEVGKSIVLSSMSMGDIVDIAKREYTLVSLISTSAGFLTNKILKNKIEFAVYCPENINIYVQKDEWQRMFMNIIKNAVEAMNSSKVRKLDIKAVVSNTVLTIDFMDTGEGISPENIEKIISGQFTNKIDGHGLGMNFVREIICKYGGSIEVNSKLSEWTNIKLTFPKSNIIKGELKS